MTMPKAQLTLDEKPTEISFDVPCPCGKNSLTRGTFVFGLGDYRSTCEKAVCGSCKRACTPVLVVQNDELQKLLKFEYNYADLSNPEYWAAHERMWGDCAAMIGKERVLLPRGLPDNIIIKSTTFSCWWENRLGIMPTLVFQQNLPKED